MKKLKSIIIFVIGILVGDLFRKLRLKSRIKETIKNKISKSLFGYQPSKSCGYTKPYYTPRYQAIKIHRNDTTFNPGRIVFDDYRSAMNAEYEIREIYYKYDKVRLADVAEICGFSTEYYSSHWGWIDISGIQIYPENDKYILSMPLCELLEDEEDDNER